jgi:hypothetical protein
MPLGLEDVCFVPRMSEYFEVSKFSRRNMIMTKLSKVETIRKWLIGRLDTEFNFPKLVGYARAIEDRITIGGVQVVESWGIEAEEFNEVLNTLFIIAAADRYKRSTWLAEGMKRLKYEQTHDGYFNRFIDFLTSSAGHGLSSQAEFIKIKDRPNDIYSKDFTHRLMQLKYVTIKDQFFQEIVPKTTCKEYEYNFEFDED